MMKYFLAVLGMFQACHLFGQLQIPPNTTAIIQLPAIGIGKAMGDNTLRFIRKEKDALIYKTGPGYYQLSVR